MYGLFAAALATVMNPPLDLPFPAIASYFARCEAEGHRLWGVSLCLPIVIVDRASGPIWTSEAAPGPLPALRANTAFGWGGRKWIMILAPVPGDATALLDLLFHEAWHGRQAGLGLPANAAVAGHLDDWRQRYLIWLEWEALRSALQSSRTARSFHIGQALAFRVQRHALAPGAATAERLQMRHEGLAAYTGAAASGAPLRRALAALDSGPGRSGLARSFAYVSGPAWAVLLDATRPGWRGRLSQGQDLPDLAGLRPASSGRPALYGGAVIERQERGAFRARQARLQSALAATSDRVSLRIPLAAIQMDYDPNQVASGPDGSTLYLSITLRDRWGRIDATATGLRISADYQTAFAPWPVPFGTLQLAPGWRVAPRAGGGAELVRDP